MTRVFKKFNSDAARILKNGGIGVIPTDTIYGVVCSALSKKSVNKVYQLRGRSQNKPVIVLIGSKFNVRMFGVSLNARTSNILNKFWPGPVSVILQMANSSAVANAMADKKEQITKFKYLHRGRKAIAFRLPKNTVLRRFLKKTGPLIAPSANFEGEPPAKTIKEAQKYFGNKVGFYIDGGKLKSKPSTLVSISDDKFRIIRQGAAKIKG
ncbi:MAG: L-threonylcarbamoyladenylate synthase [bacterium]|nr:L-threonylcarbamoyladenylate synthase [bacterium]